MYDALKEIRSVQIIENSSYNASKSAWDTLDKEEQFLYEQSAKSIIPTIFELEPNIVEKGENILNLYIQPDKKGAEADVRDIIIECKEIKWEIGFSMKHNHQAVKHSRIAKSLDFGKKWYGVECSKEYWEEVKPIFSFLESQKEEHSYFKDLSSKEDDIYVPLLNAFVEEIKRAIEKSSSVPKKFVEYLLGRYDFYKIVSIDKERMTTIQSFNIFGTLNRPTQTKEPKLKVPFINLPTSLLHIGYKPKSKTTIIICFDNGWQFSFRIHNAKDIIEPSLKFDIQIVGMPLGINIKYNCRW